MNRSARHLVATVGPASWNLVGALVERGATALRLNTSHLTSVEVAQAARAIRDAAPAVRLELDLQGSKMRLGRFGVREVAAGERVRFTLESDASSPGFAEDEARSAERASGALLSGSKEDAVPVPHPELFAALRPGELLSVDDARLGFRVDAVLGEVLETTALVAGTLRPRKGINREEHPVEPTDLSLADLRAIDATSSIPNVAFALSFVRTASELAWVRERAPGAPVVAKIERREAIAGLRSIAEAADAVWICRGDLGAQLGMVGLARAVREIRPDALACPVLMAGQVFEHLTHHEQPTRSEVCHSADLLARGYAGFVLSDETAVGVDPVNALRQAAELLGHL